MENIVRAYCSSWLSNKEASYQKYFIDVYTYGRMDQMVDCVLPWIQSAIPKLATLKILEIGAGTGSSTAGFMGNVDSIYGLDIDGAALKVAGERCALIGKWRKDITPVDLQHYPATWIHEFSENPQSYFPVSCQIAYAYALFEHLLPLERIKLLRALWKYLPVGGYLITVELPNRLSLLDWHTTGLPFADILPSDLYAIYASQSKYAEVWDDLKAHSVEQAESICRERQYRNGRAISFHEFYLALDSDSFGIVADDQSQKAIYRGNLPGYNPEYQKVIENRLSVLAPHVHRAFAASCLDLIIQKTKRTASFADE
jgi:SAM-dependent methyltransferase